jgi:hypothetical protein
MKKYNSKKYSADCSKCGMLHTGNQYYFQKDLKEKCFCGAELINFRYYGEKFDAEANAIAKKMIDDALASVRANTQKIIADEIAKMKGKN